MTDSEDVLASIQDSPHWRLLYRPEVYIPERIPTLARVRELVEKHAVRLRGWDFPHMGREDEQGRGTNWVASWSTFMGHFEYWRFYQSAQFVYLSAVREVTEEDWDRKLRGHFADRVVPPVDVSKIPGFLSIENFVYTVTEFYEFAARLVSTEVFGEGLEISIGLHGIRGFALTTGPNRAWHSLYQATEEELVRSVATNTGQLGSESNELALDAVRWFFERFGWLDLNLSALRSVQTEFLEGS